jgi:DNA-binding response OmpR family regulator
MEGASVETVLVVEDNESVRQFVSLVLRSRGYRVLEAQDGQGAVELSRKHEGAIHLLMADVGLPDITGPELARRLWNERIGLKVLFLTGSTDWEGVEPGQLLHKPFTLWTLLEKTRKVLEGGEKP